MMTSSAQKIVKAALIESENEPNWLKRRKRKENNDITLKIFQPSPVYYYLVHIYDKPISFQSLRSFNSDIKATKGLYTIQYIPLGSFKRNPKFPYLIGQDLVRLRVTVSGPQHWNMICKRIPELDWIRRNSTMTTELFRIAKMHPGLAIKFGIDFPKYCAKIEKAAEEQGIDIDHKPLFTYQWNDKVREENKDVELQPLRTKADYESALLEIERSETVQNEIKGE